MNARRMLFALFAMALVALVPVASHASEEYLKTHEPDLGNFDVYNRTGTSVRSLDLILTNMSCGRIYKKWNWGPSHTLADTIVMICTNLGGGKIKVRFTWTGAAALADGAKAHFGLGIEPGAWPHVEKMSWDDGAGVQIGPAADYAWVDWAETANGPVHISIRLPDSLNAAGVRVDSAAWVQAGSMVPLDSLTYYNWQTWHLPGWTAAPLLNKVLLTPAAIDTFWTDPINDLTTQAILVRFQLWNAAHTILLGNYLYEAKFNKDIPTLTEWGLIILALLAIAAVVWTVYRRRRVMVPA